MGIGHRADDLALFTNYCSADWIEKRGIIPYGRAVMTHDDFFVACLLEIWFAYLSHQSSGLYGVVACSNVVYKYGPVVRKCGGNL